MTVVPTVLFGRPQREIAWLIIDKIKSSISTSIVTGFLTPKGLSVIEQAIVADPDKLRLFLVGAATYPSLEGMDGLIGAGVPLDRLRVHLGHGAANGSRHKYKPMLHSKIYLMELPEDRTCAIVGSHNLTHFAMAGLNGEAAVMLEGPSAAPEFATISEHVAEAWRQAVQYDPSLKQAYAWWSKQFYEGLQTEVEVPRDYEGGRTIVVLAARPDSGRPRAGDVMYFEIPAGIGQIDSLRTEAHLFLFDPLPSTAYEALNRRPNTGRLLCKVVGIESQRGNLEITAQWHIAQARAAKLEPVVGAVHRPRPAAGMQQVRAQVMDDPLPTYEYLFERPSSEWVAELSPTERIITSADLEVKLAQAGDQLEKLPQRPTGRRPRGRRPEDNREWALVCGLRPQRSGERDQAALALAAPDSGSFILVAVSRRRLD